MYNTLLRTIRDETRVALFIFIISEIHIKIENLLTNPKLNDK